MVVSRLPSGEWAQWRVGRRRLAWKPWIGPEFLGLLMGTGTLLDLVPMTLVAACTLVNCTAALLVTLVVWPRRAASGRWPVVAYLLSPRDGDPEPQLVWTRSQSEADAIVRQWVSDIKRHGSPLLPAGG